MSGASERGPHPRRAPPSRKVRRTLYLPGYVRSAAAEAAKVAWGSGADSSIAIAAGSRGGGDGGLGWEYTERALQLVIAYQRTFPVVFALLEGLGDEPSLSLRDFPGGEDAVLRVCTWLQQLETYKRPLVPVATLFMAPAAITAVEKAADAYYAVMRKRAAAAGATPGPAGEPPAITTRTRREGVSAADVFRPEAGSSYAVGNVGEGHGTALGINSVDGAACVPLLGDRVTNLSFRQAPLGLRGTVVAVHAASGFVEVVFDAEFVGGGSLGGLCTVGRGALVPWSALLCLSREPSADVGGEAAGAEDAALAEDSGMPRGKRGGPRAAPSHGGGAGGSAAAPSGQSPYVPVKQPAATRQPQQQQLQQLPEPVPTSLQAVGAQMAFYMSPGNLIRDTFLSSNVSPDGWVPLATFASFKRMRELAAGDARVIADAVAAHCAADLELSGDRQFVRRRVPVPLAAPRPAAKNRPGAAFVAAPAPAPASGPPAAAGGSLAPSVAALFSAASGVPGGAPAGYPAPFPFPAAAPVPGLVPSAPWLPRAAPAYAQAPQFAHAPQQQWAPPALPAHAPAGGAAQYWHALMQSAPLPAVAAAAPAPPVAAGFAAPATAPVAAAGEAVASAPAPLPLAPAGAEARPHFSALLGALAKGPAAGGGPPPSLGKR